MLGGKNMLIIVKPNLFTKKTNVLLLNEEEQTVQKTYVFSVNELSVQIPKLCQEIQVNKILFIGNKNFNMKIGENIKINSISQYNLNINVEYA